MAGSSPGTPNRAPRTANLGRRGRLCVCQVVQGLGVGGLERMVASLCQKLDRRRFEPLVVCYDRVGAQGLALAAEGVPVALIPRRPGKDWRYALRLAWRLREWRVDVLHAHNNTALSYGAVATRLAGVRRMVYTEHDRTFPSPRPVAVMNGALARLTHQVCAVSERIRMQLARFEHIPPGRVRVVYNGVEVPCVADQGPAVRDELGLAGRPVVGIIGRLSPEKNHALAFRALARLAESVPRVVLLVVGGGRLADQLPAEAERAGVAGRVRFLGARTDVPRLLQAMDVVLLCSKTEGLPLVPMEAMAAGRPVVVTDVGGCREIVEDGVTGFVVPPEDGAALAARLADLLADAGRRATMGAAGRSRFQRLFTLERMVDQYQEIYEGE